MGRWIIGTAIDVVPPIVAKLKLIRFPWYRPKYQTLGVNTTMADPGIQAFQAGSEILSGAPIPFRFELTWRSVTGPLRPTPPDLPQHAVQAPTPRQPIRHSDPRQLLII